RGQQQEPTESSPLLAMGTSRNPRPLGWGGCQQIWIEPNELNIKPRYDQKAFPAQEGATLILSPTAENGSFKVYQDMKLWRYQLSADKTEQITLNHDRHYWLQVVKGDLTINGENVHSSDGIAISQETLLEITSKTDVEFLLFDLV
ncbi:pirin family protein, partial [Gallibacterium anatis]